MRPGTGTACILSLYIKTDGSSGFLLCGTFFFQEAARRLQRPERSVKDPLTLSGKFMSEKYALEMKMPVLSDRQPAFSMRLLYRLSDIKNQYLVAIKADTVVPDSDCVIII